MRTREIYEYHLFDVLSDSQKLIGKFASFDEIHEHIEMFPDLLHKTLHVEVHEHWVRQHKNTLLGLVTDNDIH